jgi:hypothetical protein
VLNPFMVKLFVINLNYNYPFSEYRISIKSVQPFRREAYAHSYIHRPIERHTVFQKPFFRFRDGGLETCKFVGIS